MLRTQFKKKQQGLAAVEFILTVPLLLILLVAVLDITRAFVQYTELTKNLQNAARFGVVTAYATLTPYEVASTSEIKNIVLYGVATPKTDKMSGEIITPKLIEALSSSDITIAGPTGLANPNLVITASFDYTPIFSEIPFTDINLNFTLTSSAMMRTGP